MTTLKAPDQTSLRSALDRAVAGLPDHASISLPVGWLREQLDRSDPPPETLTGDLDVHEAGEILDRHHTTVAAYCRRGEIPQAYKQNGREWRIPRAALQAYLKRLRDGDGADSPAPASNGSDADLSGWRDHVQATS